MKAIVVTDKAAGTAGVKLVERPEPQAAINDVVVQIHASGFTGDELTWPSTWTDRVGRDRTPSIPGHELAGVVTALGYGTTGRSIGQRVLVEAHCRFGKLLSDDRRIARLGVYLREQRAQRGVQIQIVEPGQRSYPRAGFRALGKQSRSGELFLEVLVE